MLLRSKIQGRNNYVLFQRFDELKSVSQRVMPWDVLTICQVTSICQVLYQLLWLSFMGLFCKHSCDLPQKEKWQVQGFRPNFNSSDLKCCSKSTFCFSFREDTRNGTMLHFLGVVFLRACKSRSRCKTHY